MDTKGGGRVPKTAGGGQGAKGCRSYFSITAEHERWACTSGENPGCGECHEEGDGDGTNGPSDLDVGVKGGAGQIWHRCLCRKLGNRIIEYLVLRTIGENL